MKGETLGSLLHLLSNKTLYAIQSSCRIPYSLLALSSEVADLNFCCEASKQTNVNLGLFLQVNCPVLFSGSMLFHISLCYCFKIFKLCCSFSVKILQIKCLTPIAFR